MMDGERREDTGKTHNEERDWKEDVGHKRYSMTWQRLG
jgi:hypothetical protein